MSGISKAAKPIISEEWVEIAPVKPMEALYVFVRWLWKLDAGQGSYTAQGLSERLETFRRAVGWVQADVSVVEQFDNV